jgi:rsbT co-antagonist protein RsbR
MSSPSLSPRATEGAASEERFRLLAESVRDYAIVMLDLDGLVATWNLGAERVEGYRAEEIIGQHFSIFYTPEDVAAGKPALHLSTAAEQGRFEDDSWRVRKDGSRFWANVIITALRDSDGELRGFGKITRDRTAQRELERLRAGEAKYVTLLENLPHKIFMKNEDSVYISCNRNFARDLGLAPDEIAGKTDFDFFPAELAEKYRADDRAIVESGEAREIEETYIEGGQRRVVQTSKTPVKDGAGDVIGILGIFSDITERKRMQETLTRQAREILEISTPVVQLWEGVLAIPLIGTLDSQRTQQITERLLNRIVETGSPVAIIDLTGVPPVDSPTGRHLIETLAAVRVLGTQTLLTGIRPEIAQTLVHLGIDLGGVVTRTSLSAGLRYAMEVLDRQSTHRPA